MAGMSSCSNCDREDARPDRPTWHHPHLRVPEGLVESVGGNSATRVEHDQAASIAQGDIVKRVDELPADTLTAVATNNF